MECKRTYMLREKKQQQINEVAVSFGFIEDQIFRFMVCQDHSLSGSCEIQEKQKYERGNIRG